MNNPKKQLKMIEVNLLPNIKQEVLAARRNRDRVATWSIIASGAAVALVVILGMVVLIIQNIVLSANKSRIESDFKKIKNYPGAIELLTIQKQLSNIDEIHKKKYIPSRMFTIFTQIVNNHNLDIKLSRMDVDPHAKIMIVEGYSGAGYADLEKLVKTLNESKIAYIDLVKEIAESSQAEPSPTDSDGRSNSRLAKNDDHQRVNSQQSEAKIDDIFKKADYQQLLREDVSLLDDPALGENSDGKKVLTFKLGLALENNFFSSNEKIIVAKGVSYRDVTDSYLSIPRDLFDGIKRPKKKSTDRVDKKGDK